jgi:protein-S-isoprenylcysteine O-methyltransferase Ste14
MEDLVTEAPFRIAYGIVLLCLAAGVVSYRRHGERAGGAIPESAARAAEGPSIYFSLRLLGVALWLTAFLWPLVPQWFAWAALPLPAWLRWPGAAGAAAGLPLVFWAQRALGGNVTKTVLTKREHSLVTGGPYRWVRHPLYAVGALVLVSLGLLSSNGLLLALLAVAALPLVLRTSLEERALVQRFGEAYRDYSRRTGRFLPRLGRQPRRRAAASDMA